MKCTAFEIALFLVFGYLAFNYVAISSHFPHFDHKIFYVVAVFCHFALLFIALFLAKSLLEKFLPPVFGLLLSLLVVIFFWVDFLIYETFSMHINLFLLDLLLDPALSSQAGLSVGAIFKTLGEPFLAVLTLLLGFYLSRYFEFRLSLTYIICFGAACWLVVVSVYSYQMLLGSPSAYYLKRTLPYAVLPDRYYISRVDSLLGLNKMQNVSRSHYSSGEDGEKPDIQLDELPVVSKPFNVVLIIAESFRSYDMFKDVSVTPSLHRWSERGTLLTSIYSAANCTHLSFYSIMSGKHSFYYEDRRSRLGSPLSVRVLEKSGYSVHTTEAISLDWYDLADFAFGSEVRRSTFSQSHDKSLSRRRLAIRADQWVTDNALSLAEAKKLEGKPYLNVVYYNGSHFDFNYPAVSEIFTPVLEDGYDVRSVRDKPEVEYLRNRYKNSLHFVDSEFGRLMEGLSDQGNLEDTIVIFTSDHGEEMYETGSFGHNTKLNQFQNMVPLYWYLPDSITQAFNSGASSHLEIMPTLFDLLGVPGSSGLFDGFSLLNGERKPLVATNCGPGYPDGFSLIESDKKVELGYDDGYLVPVPGQDMSSKDVERAVKILIKLLREN